MGEGGGRRWFGPSTWCLAAGGALTALYYLSPGGWSRSVVVASLSACLLVAVSAGPRFDRRRLEEKIRHQALYDPLTGLPNRTLFLDRVGHAVAGSKRRERPVAVLMIDLDGFNTVNDSFGEGAGGRVL